MSNHFFQTTYDVISDNWWWNSPYICPRIICCQLNDIWPDRSHTARTCINRWIIYCQVYITLLPNSGRKERNIGIIAKLHYILWSRYLVFRVIFISSTISYVQPIILHGPCIIKTNMLSDGCHIVRWIEHWQVYYILSDYIASNSIQRWKTLVTVLNQVDYTSQVNHIFWINYINFTTYCQVIYIHQIVPDSSVLPKITLPDGRHIVK